MTRSRKKESPVDHLGTNPALGATNSSSSPSAAPKSVTDLSPDISAEKKKSVRDDYHYHDDVEATLEFFYKPHTISLVRKFIVYSFKIYIYHLI